MCTYEQQICVRLSTEEMALIKEFALHSATTKSVIIRAILKEYLVYLNETGLSFEILKPND